MQSLQDAVDEAAERTGFSGVVRVDRAGETELCRGLRVRRPGPRDPQHGRDPVRDRERNEEPDGAGGDGPGRAGDARARHDRPFAARRRPAPDRRRRDDRAAAGTSVRDRRLPRRGRRRRHRRLRDAGAGARARDDRAVPAGAGRARDRVPRRRAVRVQQRRLRRARAAGRTGERRGLPRAGSHAGLRACGHGRHRVPALRRAPGTRRAGLPRRRRPEDERAPSPRARQRRRRHLLDRCRPQRLLGLALRRTDRLAGAGRRDGATAQRLAGGVQALRPRVPPPRRPATESGWRGTTRACRSPACTSPRRRSPTPSSRTGRTVPGRSSSCSTTASAPETGPLRRAT